jgi:hypothetical protein
VSLDYSGKVHQIGCRLQDLASYLFIFDLSQRPIFFPFHLDDKRTGVSISQQAQYFRGCAGLMANLAECGLLFW